MKIRIFSAFIILLFPSWVCAQTISSLEGYDNLLSVELKSGHFSIYETPKSSNFAVQIEMKSAPLCKTEIVQDPVRVLIDCPGKILQGTKPIKLSNSKMAKQVRFGFSGDSSKIVVDMIVDVLLVQAPKAAADKSLFIYGGKGKSWVTDEPIIAGSSTSVPASTPTPTPIPTLEKLSKEAKEEAASTGPVFTPVPLPKIEHGEIDLLSLVFSKAPQLNNPTIKISLRSGRNAEIKKVSSTQYILKISAARVFSPIFLNIQPAPDGFDPFKQAQIHEVSTPGAPVDLSIQIDLLRPAELQLKQTAGEIEVFEQMGEPEN